MSRPIPPGTLHHRQQDRSQAMDRSMDRSHHVAPSAQLNHSAQLSSHSTTAPQSAVSETPRSISAEPSAFRTVNQSLNRPPDTRPRSAGQNGYNHNSSNINTSQLTHSSRGYNGDSSSQRGLHDEDIENSTYYEYGCV